MTPTGVLLTPQQLADQWQTSVATVYRLIRQDGLPVVRLHDKADIRIDPEDAAAWLESRKVGTR
jgi:excisionase family DNA binding protein